MKHQIHSTEKRDTDLAVPAISKEEEVEAVEDEVERKPAWREELTTEPAFTHMLVCCCCLLL